MTHGNRPNCCCLLKTNMFAPAQVYNHEHLLVFIVVMFVQVNVDGLAAALRMIHSDDFV